MNQVSHSPATAAVAILPTMSTTPSSSSNSPSSGGPAASNRAAMSRLTRPQEFTAGAGAACMDVCLTYPASKLIFRQQLHGVRIRLAIRQLMAEGLPLLYRGMLPPLMQKITSRALMFGMYDHYTRVLRCSPHNGFTMNHAVAAVLSGTTEAVLCPLERVQTIMQASTYHGQFKNTGQAFAVLWTKYGVKEFYRGLVPILWRNGPSNIIFFGGRKYIPEMLPSGAYFTGSPHMVNFVTGATLGVILSVVFFPLNVVKARVQSQLGGPFQSPVKVLKMIFEERSKKWRSMFIGVHFNYTRTCFSWGVTNAAFEIFIDFFQNRSSR